MGEILGSYGFDTIGQRATYRAASLLVMTTAIIYFLPSELNRCCRFDQYSYYQKVDSVEHYDKSENDAEEKTTEKSIELREISIT